MSRPLFALVALSLVACRTGPGAKGDGAVMGDTGALDSDGDGFAADEDCDDGDAGVNGGATEVCDGVDNDCDGEVDEGVLGTFYADADADSYGDPDAPVEACTAPTGTVATATDCDDGDAAVNPAALEACDGIDNDCDGEVDEELLETFWADVDGDGWGDAAEPVEACVAPSGAVDNDGDCDDGSADISPDASEVCDGVDNDCDGTIDEDDALDAAAWYLDQDGDGYGSGAATAACTAPSGMVDNDADCDDTSLSNSPDGVETCDGADNDCDGTIDEDDATDAATWYTDADADGYGDAASSAQACAQPSGFVADDSDCDDAVTSTNPGAAEVCDGADNDCDGTTDEPDATDAATWYADADTDGYGDPATSTTACSQPSGYLADASDCDDTDASRNPDTVWYRDADSDTYGDAASTTAQCLQPSGYVSDDTDCDDTDGTVYPGASDAWYDGVDADCAGDDDYDQDGDGETPYAYGGTDCDDTDASLNDAAGTCRASCTPPSTTTLAAYDPSGVSDLQFDADCDAWVSTLISGTDYVYTIDSTGSRTIYTGTSNHNIGSLALDPSSTAFAVSYNNVGYLGVSSGSSIPVVATGGFRSGSNFSNGYLRQSASSLAWDTSGCIWVPNFAANGSIDCFSSSGSYSTRATLSGYVESVALDPDDDLYVSVGATVYAVSSAGATSTYYTLSDTVLDMVFDITGELYVLTDANDIVVVDAGGTGEAVFATVSSEGKLAISPDGTLYHLDSQPVGAASYSSWSL